MEMKNKQERFEVLVNEIKELELQPPLDELAEEYQNRIGEREDYLWRRINYKFRPITLDTVPDERLERVCTQKTVLVMFVVLADDLAENLDDIETFREMRKIPTPDLDPDLERPDVRTEYLDFGTKVWDTFDSLLAETENYEEYLSCLEFDVRQILNAIDYERLANAEVNMINKREMMHHSQHNLMGVASVDIDLMNSPEFDHAEYGQVREAAFGGQQLARISNWAFTWEREFEEDDFASGIVAEALSRDVITMDDIEAYREDPTKERLSTMVSEIQEYDLESELLEQWEALHAELIEEVPDTDSTDLVTFLEGLENVRDYHMASRYYR